MESAERTIQDVLERAVLRLFFTAPHLGQAVIDAWPDNTGKLNGRIARLAQVPTDGPNGGKLWYVVDKEQG